MHVTQVTAAVARAAARANIGAAGFNVLIPSDTLDRTNYFVT